MLLLKICHSLTGNLDSDFHIHISLKRRASCHLLPNNDLCIWLRSFWSLSLLHFGKFSYDTTRLRHWRWCSVLAFTEASRVSSCLYNCCELCGFWQNLRSDVDVQPWPPVWPPLWRCLYCVFLSSKLSFRIRACWPDTRTSKSFLLSCTASIMAVHGKIHAPFDSHTREISYKILATRLLFTSKSDSCWQSTEMVWCIQALSLTEYVLFISCCSNCLILHCSTIEEWDFTCQWCVMWCCYPALLMPCTRPHYCLGFMIVTLRLWQSTVKYSSAGFVTVPQQLSLSTVSH